MDSKAIEIYGDIKWDTDSAILLSDGVSKEWLLELKYYSPKIVRLSRHFIKIYLKAGRILTPEEAFVDSKAIEIYGDIKWDTDSAILLSDGVSKEWLPKSQIEIREVGDGVEVKMPEWLAKKKGFI